VAIKAHNATESAALWVHTDGSGIDGHVGAAVIAPMGARSKYSGEENNIHGHVNHLYRISSGAHRNRAGVLRDVHARTNSPMKCIDFTDNQAAIQAMVNPKPPSGQYILARGIQD
jgi:hypothetical protein